MFRLRLGRNRAGAAYVLHRSTADDSAHPLEPCRPSRVPPRERRPVVRPSILKMSCCAARRNPTDGRPRFAKSLFGAEVGLWGEVRVIATPHLRDFRKGMEGLATPARKSMRVDPCPKPVGRMIKLVCGLRMEPFRWTKIGEGVVAMHERNLGAPGKARRMVCL